MAKKKFVLQSELGELTEEQKQDYYLAACEHLGLPPELRLLEYYRMDTGDSGSKLVLYTKKGATDIIREKLGINTIGLTKEVIDGCIVYTVTGVNKNGRTEIAIGAASIKNLIGRALESAFMTGQTRGTRRMTLQFAGAGLIDESELQTSVTTDLAQADKPLSQLSLARPSVAPSSLAGKDITVAPIQQEHASSENIAPEVRKAGDEIIKSMADSLKKEIAVLDSIVVKKKRGRRTKAQISLDTAAQAAAQPAVEPESKLTLENLRAMKAALTAPLSLPKESSSDDILDCLRAATPDEIEVELVEPKQAEAAAPIQTNPVEQKSLVIVDLPNKEQIGLFRIKLADYTNNHLPRGGMTPTAGVGGIATKLKILISKIFPDVTDTKMLTVTQWGQFLEFMNTKMIELGPQGLVKTIHEMIGVKE